MTARTLTTARQPEIEANQLDMLATEVQAAQLTREQLAIAWRQLAAIRRTQAAEIRAELSAKRQAAA